MQTTIYTTFRDSDQAGAAFDELLTQGASLLDVAVINEHAYQAPEIDTADGQMEHGCSGSEENPIDGEAPLEIPECLDPFEDAPCGIHILDNLTYPGDLSNCLNVLGFARPVAQQMEATVLEGGALLILRLPSGSINEEVAIDVMEAFGGSTLTTSHFRPYLA